MSDDTAQRMARAHRAQMAWDEFLGVQIEEMIGEYASRIVDLANTELDPNKRRDKITALSNAIKIVENIRTGLHAAITDGDMAKRDKLRAKNIEQMSAPRRRLLNIIPG